MKRLALLLLAVKVRHSRATPETVRRVRHNMPINALETSFLIQNLYGYVGVDL